VHILICTYVAQFLNENASKATGSKIYDKFCTFYSPVNIRRGWTKCQSQDFNFSRVPNLLYTSGEGAAARAGRLNTIYRPDFFNGRYITMSHSRSVYYGVGSFKTGFRFHICTSLHFDTEAPRCRKFGQISKYLTPSKIDGKMAEMSELERSSVIIAQSRSIRFPTSSSVLRTQCVKCNWYWKSKPDIELFDFLWNLGKEWAKCLIEF